MSDLRSVRNALELFRAQNNTYPTTLTPLAPNFLPAVPRDPDDNSNYGYAATGNGGAACNGSPIPCTNYVLGALLEAAGNGAVNADFDGAQAFTLRGQSTNCNSNAGAANEVVYCTRID